MLLMIMEMGSTDLNSIFKVEITRHNCVREPDRVFYWVKMLEAVKAVHEAGIYFNKIDLGLFLN